MKYRMISKSVPTVLCLLISMGLMTGCFFRRSRHVEKPTEEDLVEAVEELAKGENIEYLGDGRFSSLDRDLEFEEQWVLHIGSGEGTDAPRFTGPGSYYLDSQLLSPDLVEENDGRVNYYTAIYRYWLDEIFADMESFPFENVEVPDTVTGRRIGRDFYISFDIYITPDITDEQVESVASLLSYFRDICVEEQQFHDETFFMSFYVEIILWDEDEDLCFRTGDTYNINSDTEEYELELDLDWNNPDYQWHDRPAPQYANNGYGGGYTIVIIAG